MDKVEKGDGQNHPNYKFQYLAAWAASLATLSTGSILGWPSQIGQSMLKGAFDFPIDNDQLGWICSATSLGAGILSLFIGSISDRFGRKLTMLIMVCLLEAGWCFIIFANSVALLVVGRLFTGMIGGALCVLVPLYIYEISQKEIRGSVGCFTQLMISTGTLFSNVVSIKMNVRHFSMMCTVIPVIFAAVFVFMPESPIFLVEHGRESDAVRALQWLRGKSEVSAELDEVKMIVNSHAKENVLAAVKRCFEVKATRKAVYIAFGLALIKALSGIDAICAYLGFIFEDSHVEIGAETATIIFTVVQILSVVFSVFVVDKWGRKVMLTLSGILMSLTLATTAISLMIRQEELFTLTSSINTLLGYIPLVSLCLYNVAFCLGIGPIGWSLGGEIFPNEIKGRAMSAYTMSIWLMAFGTVKLYYVVYQEVHSYASFFIYSVAMVLGTLFVVFFVPETRNRSYKEIERELSS